MDEAKKQELIITRRLFRNPQGDWKKAEKLAKEIMTYAQVVDGLAVDLVKADRHLRQLQLEAYQAAKAVDSLFYDSPVSPARQTMHLKMYLKKLGWDGIRDLHTPSVSIEAFTKNMVEATRWLLKFKDVET